MLSPSLLSDNVHTTWLKVDQWIQQTADTNLKKPILYFFQKFISKGVATRYAKEAKRKYLPTDRPVGFTYRASIVKLPPSLRSVITGWNSESTSSGSTNIFLARDTHNEPGERSRAAKPLSSDFRDGGRGRAMLHIRRLSICTCGHRWTFNTETGQFPSGPCTVLCFSFCFPFSFLCPSRRFSFVPFVPFVPSPISEAQPNAYRLAKERRRASGTEV